MSLPQMPRDSSCAAVNFIGFEAAVSNELSPRVLMCSRTWDVLGRCLLEDVHDAWGRLDSGPGVCSVEAFGGESPNDASFSPVTESAHSVTCYVTSRMVGIC